MVYSRAKPPCRVSDPAQPHNLCRRRRPSPLSICFSCKRKKLTCRKYYYYCATCNLNFHRGCHRYPPILRHPLHPSHPLTLTSSITRNGWWDGSSDSEGSTNDDISDDDDDGDGDGDGDGDDDDDDDAYGSVNIKDYQDVDVDASLSDGNHRSCRCCNKPLDKTYYHCSICKFNLNLHCSMMPPLLTISHMKSHEHTLTLFCTRLPMACDACGLSLSTGSTFLYTCLPCSHTVHIKCIYLPRVIQITRHKHRLSFTLSLQPGEFSCGVCRKTVDVNYGQYSCIKGCHYAVHSYCATRNDVWDGEDLEGVPEEPDEDIEPFVRIDEETIHHFSHEHYLKLQEKKTICEKVKYCVACTIPIIISQRFYGCVECDFVLDEACAALPRKKYLPIHIHPLTLHPIPIGRNISRFDFHTVAAKHIFKCKACYRLSCGFVYKCGEEYCEFQIDVRCASLPDPLIHGCHPHDLFFNLTDGRCIGCLPPAPWYKARMVTAHGSTGCCSSYYVECIKCDHTFLGMACASLPSEAYYKHDRHLLTLCYGEEEGTTTGQYWCEICESELSDYDWFYTCDSCLITLHIDCLLGKDMYMKPGHIFEIGDDGDEVEIVHNDGNTRLICSECNLRCAQAWAFKLTRGYKWYCTLNCMGKGLGLGRLNH